MFSADPVSGASSVVIHRSSISFKAILSGAKPLSSSMENNSSKSSQEKSTNLFNILVEMAFAIGLFCIVSTKLCNELTLKVTRDHGMLKMGVL